MNSREDESQDSSIPAYSYLPGGLKAGGIDITPHQSRETSPEIQDTAVVEMGNEDENLKALKKTRGLNTLTSEK